MDKVKSFIKKIPFSVFLYKTIIGLAAYAVDVVRFVIISRGARNRFKFFWTSLRPCITDRVAKTGFDHHYIFHPAWAARVLAHTRPEVHVDISSSLSFCSIVSSFIPVHFYDYRPADLNLEGLSSGHADLLSLPFPDGSVSSLSCMHVVEHVGLGRYGDPLDPEGDLKAIEELQRVIAPGGNLLFVVPISGTPRIEFNAHRVYSQKQVLEYFSHLSLKEFALIEDSPAAGGLIRNATREQADAQHYGCGCFWFQKRG